MNINWKQIELDFRSASEFHQQLEDFNQQMANQFNIPNQYPQYPHVQVSNTALPMSALKTQVGGDHYVKMAIQPVEFVYKNNIPFIEAACIGYLCRWRDKGGVKDLEKVKHFMEILIELEKNK